jgi:hypothetical protein
MIKYELEYTWSEERRGRESAKMQEKVDKTQ